MSDISDNKQYFYLFQDHYQFFVKHCTTLRYLPTRCSHPIKNKIVKNMKKNLNKQKDGNDAISQKSKKIMEIVRNDEYVSRESRIE